MGAKQSLHSIFLKATSLLPRKEKNRQEQRTAEYF
jgi:hypothetical protein